MQDASMLTGILPVTSLQGVSASWPIISTILGNSFFFVIATTLLSLFLTSACLVFKHMPLMFNDLKNITNNEMPQRGLMLWIAFILLIPLFFDAGPMLLILWWFLLLWGYMIPSEKRIAFFFVFLILMSSWIAHVGAGFITYTQTQLNRQIYSVEHKHTTPEDIEAVSSWVQSHTADCEPMNAMALIEINRGNYSDAAKLLNRAIDLEPDNPRYYNHLGIALVGSGKKREAVKVFQYAASLSPDNMLYYFNLSRLHQSSYSFYEAEKAIATASGLDADMVSYLLDVENAQGSARYIQEYTPSIRQLARQMRPSDDLMRAADALWGMAFGMIPRRASIFLAFGAFMAFTLLSYIPDEKFTKKCSRCGKLYYSGTMTPSGNPMCLQCHWIDAKARKQQGSIVHHKTEEIRKYKTLSYQKLLRLELFLPGLGSFLTNRTGVGLTRIVILSALMLAVITGGRFMVSFIPVQADPAGSIRIMGIIAFGLLLLRAYKAPPIRYGV